MYMGEGGERQRESEREGEEGGLEKKKNYIGRGKRETETKSK